MNRTSSKRRAKARRKAAVNNVDEYLSSIPEQSRRAFLELRSIIRSVVPRQAEEIISYRIPAFKHKRVLVWFAAFANHCSLFPTAAVIQQFRNELEGFSISKGTIQFPLGKSLPKELIKKIVRARVEAAGE
jgi:uncharacterized protein YdhG (YjbR/CyaY superfamily)